jgi:hypothetical protein
MRNLDDSKFPAREIDALNFVVDGSTHDWSNYFLAALKVGKGRNGTLLLSNLAVNLLSGNHGA